MSMAYLNPLRTNPSTIQSLIPSKKSPLYSPSNQFVPSCMPLISMFGLPRLEATLVDCDLPFMLIPLLLICRGALRIIRNHFPPLLSETSPGYASPVEEETPFTERARLN